MSGVAAWTPSGTRIDLGVFAHDEAPRIAGLLQSLSEQDIFATAGIDLRVLVLANGCSDDTAGKAREAVASLPPDIARHIEVLDLPQKGKSRTGHRFIHDLSRKNADILCFMDADIQLPRSDTLRRMAEALISRPELAVFTSRPVKDVSQGAPARGMIARVIAAGGDGLSDWRKSICGQLFMIRTPAARRIGLPAGLPVEDGFIRAMVLTDLLTAPEEMARIDGDPEVFHVYQSIRDVGTLVRHQTRLVIGSAVNSALFARIRREAADEPAAHALLMAASARDGWVAETLRADLPRLPHGYVPFSFMVKRLRRFRSAGRWQLRPALLTAAGFSLDLLVWARASMAMMRGKGADHW